MANDKVRIDVQGESIAILKVNDDDYISLTDMVKGFEGQGALIEQWLRNKDTLLFLGTWETLYNDNFNYNENKSVNYDEYERVKCPVKKHCLIISRMNTPDLVGSCGYTESSYQNIFLPDRLWQVSLLKKFYYIKKLIIF